jgi:putative copper resistance protein D
VLGHLAAAVTVGALLMVVTVLPRTLPARPRGHPDRPGRPAGPAAASSPVRGCLLLAGAAAGVWAVAGAARLVLGYAGVAGESPASPTFGAQLGLFVGEVSLGRTLLATTLLAALTCTLALAVTGPTGAAWTLAVAIAALGILAQTGHAAGTANHGLAVSSMVLHLTGSAVWVGGLAVLCLLARRLRGALPAAAQRYSVLALWSFLGVAISGLVNAWVRVGGPDGLATPYGRLVLAKAAALAVLGGAGWLHRAVTLRALGVRPRLFWRLAGVEVLVMGAVTGLAVALAGTSPPVPEEAPASPTPVEVVTGYPAPPEPSPQLWFTQWRPDLLLALAGVVMVVV